MTLHRHALLAAVATCCTLPVVRAAHALDEDADSAAREALGQARDDYSDEDYEGGKERLAEALSACERDECSKRLEAALHRELGAMEFQLGNEEAAETEFATAHSLAPDLPFTHNDEPPLAAIWKRTKPENERPVPSEDAPEERRTPVETPSARGFARVWLGIGGALDFVALPSGSDLCKLSATGAVANNLGVYCTNPDGSDFPSRSSPGQNDSLVPGESGQLEGGITDGNLRLLLALDYAPISTMLIGVRIGYAFNSYPGSAADKGFPFLDRNLHAELRATYVFGKDPLARIGFAPMAFLAGGASEFDAYVSRYVSLSGRGEHPVNIWIVRGPWFVAAGAGARYQFSPRVAFNAALRLNAVLGDPSLLLTAGPDIGVSYGF